MRIVPSVNVFLMYLCEELSSMSYYSTILIPIPFIHFFFGCVGSSLLCMGSVVVWLAGSRAQAQ